MHATDPAGRVDRDVDVDQDVDGMDVDKEMDVSNMVGHVVTDNF